MIESVRKLLLFDLPALHWGIRTAISLLALFVLIAFSLALLLNPSLIESIFPKTAVLSGIASTHWVIKTGVFGGILLIFLAFILLVWRDPSSLRSIFPGVHTRLEKGVKAFFRQAGKYPAPTAEVFGEAKNIVRRMKDDPKVLDRLPEEIQNRGGFKHVLQQAFALVCALGLTNQTTLENEVFMQMPLPDI